MQFPKEYHYEPENGPHFNAHCVSTLYMCRADVGKAALPIALAVSGMSGASGGHAQPIATPFEPKAQSLTQCQCRTSKTCKLSTSAQHRGQQRNAAHTRATERERLVFDKDHALKTIGSKQRPRNKEIKSVPSCGSTDDEKGYGRCDPTFNKGCSFFQSGALFLVICIYLLYVGAKICNLLTFGAKFLICTVHRFFHGFTHFVHGFYLIYPWFLHVFT